MAFANGARQGFHWLTPEIGGVLRKLFGVPDEVIRTDVPQHPELWGDLCGWYHFSAHLSDPGKLAIGARVEVSVRRGPLPVGIGDGLPQEVQVIGPRYREDLCLDAAAAIEERVGIITPIDPR